MTVEGALIGGRYRLDQPIGRGRVGIVWLAYDTRLHRTVAAKRLYLPAGLSREAGEQANAGAIAQGRDAMRIAHDSVVSVHDVLIDTDPWLVMEYVPSRNMTEFLEQHGQLNPQQGAMLGAQLGSGLRAAHGLGIAHGALEPGNVLLADDGGVHATDVGIAGAGAHPAYRAPELSRGAQPTPASDSFSLGATVYRAVEGTPPFGDEGTSSQRTPRKTAELTEVLLQLVHPEPGMRPDLEAATDTLAAIAAGKPGPAHAPTMPRHLAPLAAPVAAQHAPAATPSRGPVPAEPADGPRLGQAPLDPPPRGQPMRIGIMHESAQATVPVRTRPMSEHAASAHARTVQFPAMRASAARTAEGPASAWTRSPARTWSITVLAVLIVAAVALVLTELLLG